MRRSIVTGPALEVVVLTAMMLSCIWLWQGDFPGDFCVCVGLYLGIGIWSHWRWKETPAQIGVRLDNFGAAFVYGARLVAPIALAAIAVGACLGTIRPLPPVEPFQVARGLAWGMTWATLQQYGLACVFYRRLHDLTGNHWGAAVGAAGFFALFHIPNPFLVPVTLVAGVIACTIYRRNPNLFALGLLHLLLSFALRYAFGPGITHHMKVGPGYWKT